MLIYKFLGVFILSWIAAIFLQTFYDILTFEKGKPSSLSEFPPTIVYFCKYSIIITIIIILMPFIRHSGTLIIKYTSDLVNYLSK